MLCKITDPNCTSEYNGDVELPELGKWYSWEEVMTLAAFNVSITGYGFVYVYYDMVNRKYYVGVCKQAVRKRSRQHYNKTGKLSRIDSIIKDIGCNHILICIVKVCKVEDLAYFENYFMGILNTLHPNGYNIRKSGYRNTNSNIQEMLSRELPKERLLDLLNNGYTYETIASTMLPIKIAPQNISIYARPLGIIIRDRTIFSVKKIAELARKGYSNKKIADTIGARSLSTIKNIRLKNNIPSGGKKIVRKPVLKIDLSSGVVLARYASASEASGEYDVLPTSMSNIIRRKTIKDGAYLVYEEDYLKQQRSSTQVAEGA